MEPEIQAGVKDRHNTQKDYDYHRGKLKALELKKEAYEKDGKSDSKAALENAEELEKFQKKVESGLENYNRHNEKTKSDIIAAKKNHDQLMVSIFSHTYMWRNQKCVHIIKYIFRIMFW